MLQASYHQGDAIFKGNGRQCMANAVSCLYQSKHSKPSTWTSLELNRILQNGDDIYQSIVEKTPGLTYLMVTDLPDVILNRPLTISKTLAGNLKRKVTEQPFFSLKTAVQDIYKADVTGLILTFGSTSPSYSCSIVCDDEQYYFFDPHCRNVCGMVCDDTGKATLTVHKNLNALCLFVEHLSASINKTVDVPFELCGVKLYEEISVQDCVNWDSEFDCSSDSGSEFSGFDPVNDSELLCLKEKLQSLENVSVSDCSETDVSGNLSDFTDFNDSMSDLIDETLEAQNMSDIMDSSFLNDITIIIEEQGVSCSDKPSHDLNADVACPLVPSPDQNPDVACSVSSSHNLSIDPESPSVQNNNTNLKNRQSRKRVRNETEWKRNILKHKKNTGQSYITKSGKIKRARVIKAGCGISCRRKCHSHISQDEREKIFHNFWSTACYEKQKEFIAHTIEEIPRKRIVNKANSKRKLTRQYFFQKHGQKIQVCKTFYHDTLDITEAVANKALNKKRTYGGITAKDLRGRHTKRANKVPDQIVTDIKNHIESYPRIESHYCRKQSKKEYLEANLSLSKMYYHYKQHCSENNLVPQSVHTYRYIFNTHYNIAFQKPLKDQCDVCFANKNMHETKENEPISQEFERHIKNKRLARERKEADKALAEADTSHVTACFDLQQVFTLPKSFQGQLYYSRKLNNYNLTVYSLGDHEAWCYIWNETVANRGSNEISSCIFDFYKNMADKGVETVSTYSDNCSGQNRNRYFVVMMWYALKFLHLKSVTHKFLERGHTQNENDSVHSCIERACKNISIYTTSQFATTVQLARRTKPYHVTEMTSDHFFDFKLMETNIRNLDLDTNGLKIKWREIRQIEFSTEDPDCMKIKYDHDGAIHMVRLQPHLRKRSQLPKLYPLFGDAGHPELSRDKYNDLVLLCRRNIIPPAYHNFYEKLPHM